MEATVRTSDNHILQFGQSIGAMEGCETVEIDDSLLDTLQQPGVKTLEADGSISVAPDLAAQAAEQARQQAAADAEAERAQAVQTLMAAMPTDAARQALAVILGLPQQ